MAKVYQIHYPKCHNNHSFYRYCKDKSSFQKYLYRKCDHQFAPDAPAGIPGRPRQRPYPAYPVCGKATFLHHDMEHYTNYRCYDKHCNHSFFVPKPTVVQPPSMSTLFDKTDFKRMRYPIHVILMTLSMFFLGKNSFRNIALILQTAMNIWVSHTTIGNWCTHFAPLFQNIAIQLIPALDFNSDEWHADETVVKIQGQKYYLWLIVDAETRFVLGFHLSPHRDSSQAFTLLKSTKLMGKPQAIVTDSYSYSAYKVPFKAFDDVKHIHIQNFGNDITNNLIECFNKQFKA